MEIAENGGRGTMVRGEGAKTRSPADRILWACWGKYRGADERGARSYHAAIAHMCDVGAVCEALIPAWAETFARLLGCAPVLAARWVPFLVAAHDVGKLQPGFLQKIDDPAILAAQSSHHRDCR